MNTHEKLEEGYSTQRPPMFNGKFYTYWKNRMEIFIKAENYQVWRVIEVGNFEVTKTNAENEVVPKPISEFVKEDFEKYEINAMAVKILHCGLGPHEHNRVMGCKSAKQIWDLLQVTHEGTNEVKRSKIDLLMSKYERFEMHPQETIQEMFTRFTNITNELVSLGRIIPSDEQVRKILRSMPQDDRWRTKVTALFETKDFTKFNIEQLAGSLMTHELHLGSAVPENPKNQGLALKAEELEDSEPDEEEAATLVRRMKRLYRNLRPGNQKGRNSGRRTIGSKSGQGCFKCGDPDHQIRECPQWEYEKGKGEDRLKERCNKPTFSKPKKAMIAAWGDVTDSEDDDDQPEKETANLCLMAKIDGTMQDPSNEVSFTASQSLSNNRLIESPIETLVFLEKLSVVKEQSNKALEPNKDHMTYLNNVRYEVQGRFLELPVRNNSLKDSFRRVKNVHTILDETNNANEVQERKNFDIGLIRLTDNDEEDSPAELHKKDQGVPMQEEQAENQGVPMQEEQAKNQGVPMQEEQAEKQGVPMQEEQAENQGVLMQEEQVENNLEFQVQEEQVENNLGFHVQEEQANQEVPIREEQAEKTGVSVQEEQEGLKWMLRNKLDEHGTIASLYGN
ncbi:uncharacterized protein [Spinacia oleracea]|uniref:CCHC-type domain-containing protein n=1 Tax=Spinacia oleracea TaxID=3562 RepID=A0ABM3RD16_SPIOL|nr:uncharacterized protein LOC130468049 [Spinacia oleracea]